MYIKITWIIIVVLWFCSSMHALLNVTKVSDMLTIASFAALVVMNNFNFSTSNVNTAFVKWKISSRETREITFFLLFGIAKTFLKVSLLAFLQYFSRALNSSSFSHYMKNCDIIGSFRYSFFCNISKILFKLQFFSFFPPWDQKTRSYHDHPIFFALSLHTQSNLNITLKNDRWES